MSQQLGFFKGKTASFSTHHRLCNQVFRFISLLENHSIVYFCE